MSAQTAAMTTATSDVRRWSPTRVGARLVIASWAGAFWFLWLTGRWSLFLSSRTAWVVPLGALLCTTAAVGRLVSARVPEPRPLGRREAWSLGLVMVPVVVVLTMPPATLSASAARTRASFAGAGVSTSGSELGNGSISLVDVAAAQTSRSTMSRLRERAGETVTFEGLVTEAPDAGPGEFTLTRFVITCCVADAAAVQVRVVDAPSRFPDDAWVRVTGALYPVGTVVVQASDVQRIAPPAHPYLTP